MVVWCGLAAGAGAAYLWWLCWPVPGAAPVLPQQVPPAPGPARGHWGRAVAGLLPAPVAGVAVGTVVHPVSRSVVVAAALGGVVATVAAAVVVGRRRARRRLPEECWPDAVDQLRACVRAGLSLPDAIAQLAHRGPEPLRPAFAGFTADRRATDVGTALDLLKDRLADPVGDRVCEALKVARDVGGTDLGDLLRSVSVLLRDDARVRGELRARQSWTVNAARLGAAAPWAVLTVLSGRPEAVAPYESVAGVVVVGTGAAVTGGAYLAMLRLGRLPRERRVLA